MVIQHFILLIFLVSCSKDPEPVTETPANATQNEPVVEKVSAEKVIQGKISIIPELSSKLKSTETLFVIARDFQTEQIVAIRKYPVKEFPMDYIMTSSQQILPNANFNGPFRISVLIDQDGVLGALEAGDLMGNYPGNPVYVGASAIDILVDTIQP